MPKHTFPNATHISLPGHLQGLENHFKQAASAAVGVLASWHPVIKGVSSDKRLFEVTSELELKIP